MCVKCFISDAANAGDWDEVARLAREQKKAEKAEDKAEAADDVQVEKKAASKASSK